MYFQWGEIEGNPNKSTTPDKIYDWSTYRFSTDTTGTIGSNANLNKYCRQSKFGYNGFTDWLTVLEPKDDAAHINLGGAWRMPTNKEFQELINNTISGTDNNSYGIIYDYNGTGIAGMLRKSKTNNNTIFFPAAGYSSSGSMRYIGSQGHYWSNSLYTSNDYSSYYLSFSSSGCVAQNYTNRYSGNSIRGVLDPNSV